MPLESILKELSFETITKSMDHTCIHNLKLLSGTIGTLHISESLGLKQFAPSLPIMSNGWSKIDFPSHRLCIAKFVIPNKVS